MESGYTPEGYYIANINGAPILFTSFEEYVEYIYEGAEL